MFVCVCTVLYMCTYINLYIVVYIKRERVIEK